LIAAGELTISQAAFLSRPAPAAAIADWPVARTWRIAGKIPSEKLNFKFQI